MKRTFLSPLLLSASIGLHARTVYKICAQQKFPSALKRDGDRSAANFVDTMTKPQVDLLRQESQSGFIFEMHLVIFGVPFYTFSAKPTPDKVIMQKLHGGPFIDVNTGTVLIGLAIHVAL